MPNSGLVDLGIAQQGCTRVGIEPISTFEGDTAEQRVLTASYETVVRAMLTKYRYSWSRLHLQLWPSNTKPLIQWETAYLIPADSVLEASLWINEIDSQYQRFNEYIMANTSPDDEVILEYHYRVDTRYWPPIFANAMAWSMAALLKAAVQEKADEAQALQALADDEFERAQYIDSSSQTNRGFKLDAYRHARRGGPGARRRRLR